MGVFDDDSSESSSNLDPTTTNDDRTITTPTNDDISAAEAYYNTNGFSKAVLFAMAIGLKEETGDADLLQLDKEPWCKIGGVGLSVFVGVCEVGGGYGWLLYWFLLAR